MIGLMQHELAYQSGQMLCEMHGFATANRSTTQTFVFGLKRQGFLLRRQGRTSSHPELLFLELLSIRFHLCSYHQIKELTKS